MDKQKQTALPDDEIDFGPLVNWLNVKRKGWSGFVSLKRKQIKESKILFLYLGLLGLIAGLCVYFLVPPTYSSEVILVSRGYSSPFNRQKIDALQKLIEDESYSTVADILHLSEQDAENLTGISYAHLDPDLNVKDTLIENLFFTVSVDLLEINMLDSLQSRIVSYLDKNAFAELNRDLQVRKLKRLITKLDGDIKAMDSLKNQLIVTEVPGTERGGFVFGEPLNPIDFYREENLMYERKLDLEIIIDLIDNVQLVSGFQKYTKPSFPRIRHIIFSVLAGLTLALIYVLFFKKNSTQ